MTARDAYDACDGTLRAVPPELVREAARAFSACSDHRFDQGSDEGSDRSAAVEPSDVRTSDVPGSSVRDSQLLASHARPPDALLDAGVHALTCAVARDCSTRDAALPLLAADALVTRAMELAAQRYGDPAELRDFAERAMLRLGAAARTPRVAGGLR